MSLSRTPTGPGHPTTTRLAVHLWPLAIGGVFLLAGCPTDVGSSATTPSTPPKTSPAPIGSGGGTGPSRSAEDVGATTNGTLAGAQLRVVVKAAGAGTAIAGAQVSIHGPGLAFGTTGTSGEVVLGPLPLGTYELRVASAGNIPAVNQVTLSVVRSRTTHEAKLTAAARTLTGQVRDQNGNPLAGARVALGTAWTMTAADGSYSLPAGPDGAAEVRKTGYASSTTSGGEVRLSKADTKASFENGVFGGAAGTAFATLRSSLSQAGITVADGDAGAQIRIWTAPSAITDVQAAAARSFVAGGGKLVVLGDWAGASQYSPEAANRLLMPLGASIDSNLVRVPGSTLGRSEWFVPTLAAGTPAGTGTINLLGAASVQAAAPAIRFMSIPQTGYSVQATADPGDVGVARQIGSGLLIVLGDASAWLDPEIARSDNLSFIRNVLLW